MQLLVGLPPHLVMNSRPFLASLLCASLASLAAPAAARAQLPPAGLRVSGPLATALVLDAKPVNTSVLGLRSEDGKAGEGLTSALRKAFAEREMSGGQELTLEEVVLTLDCSSEQDTACMTEAGRALETERLVYGTLVKSGGSYTLDIIVLDVTSGQIEAQATMPLEDGALSSSNVASTATDVVNSLYPQADNTIIAPMPVGELSGDGEDRDVDDQGQDQEAEKPGFVWGPYSPRPAWKKAGLGISVALLIAGTGVGIWGWVDGNRIKKERVEPYIEANSIVRDAKIGPFCWDAVQGTKGQSGIIVEDDGLARVCRDFNRRRVPYIVGLSTAVAAGISTATFLVLYFVHRDKARGADARKRSFKLTGGPTPGGAMLGGTGRF